MLAKFTRSSAEPEDPTIAINRLLGLLESVVNQQADLIEEIMEPSASASQKLHLKLLSTRPVK